MEDETNQPEKQQIEQSPKCPHVWVYVGTSGFEKILKCKKCGKTRAGGTDPMIVAAAIAGI